MEEKHLIVKGGKPSDYPGCWIISGRLKDEADTWGVFRKPDGTYWYIVQEDFFPHAGGTLQVELGAQIVDVGLLERCSGYYTQLKQQRYRVEVFDCPERGSRNFVDRESAEEHKGWLIKKGVEEVNIRIVLISSDGAAT
jgi:hypothetical protein